MELAVVTGAILIGLFIFIGSFDIRLGSGYDRIGPRFFPFVVATGLLISAVLVLAQGLFKGQVHYQQRTGWSAFVVLLLGLVLTVLLLMPAGFIIAATVLFVLVARAFSSRRMLRDAVAGLLLALIVYFSFTAGLGLALPKGILAGLI
jgi:putative tricarboxylic transport membrane protein